MCCRSRQIYRNAYYDALQHNTLFQLLYVNLYFESVLCIFIKNNKKNKTCFYIFCIGCVKVVLDETTFLRQLLMFFFYT